MKTTLIILLTLTCGCSGSAEKRAIDWIDGAKKPVINLGYVINGFNCRKYTLIDADGKIYLTDGVYINLPDTIK
jgi:hypothetical protein